MSRNEVVNLSFLSAFVSAYVRRFSQHGQECLSNGVEQVTGSHVCAVKSEEGFAMRLSRLDVLGNHILKRGFGIAMCRLPCKILLGQATWRCEPTHHNQSLPVHIGDLALR
jgi:hypothetical protein